MKPSIRDNVIYRTDGRNGLAYDLPAVVTVTRASHPGDYPCEWCGRNDVPAGEECPANGTQGCRRPPNPLPVPTDDDCVHLTVFTPGGFGSRILDGSGATPAPEDDTAYVGARGFQPGSGTYVEWDVPSAESVEGSDHTYLSWDGVPPRTWRYG